MRTSIADAEARVDRLTGQIADHLPNWNFAPVVEAGRDHQGGRWSCPARADRGRMELPNAGTRQPNGEPPALKSVLAISVPYHL